MPGASVPEIDHLASVLLWHLLWIERFSIWKASKKRIPSWNGNYNGLEAPMPIAGGGSQVPFGQPRWLKRVCIFGHGHGQAPRLQFAIFNPHGAGSLFASCHSFSLPICFFSLFLFFSCFSVFLRVSIFCFFFYFSVFRVFLFFCFFASLLLFVFFSSFSVLPLFFLLLCFFAPCFSPFFAFLLLCFPCFFPFLFLCFCACLL